MKLMTMAIILAALVVGATLLYERFVPLSVKQTIHDMVRIIKGK